VAVLTLATISTQALSIKPVFATGDGGYPWIDAHALYSSPDYTSSYGYTSPCPSKDTECMNGGSSLIGTVNGVTYGEADLWHYGLRNCTSYVAWRINQSFPGTNINGWGDAKDWAANAPSSKVHSAGSYTPVAGDIAQWNYSPTDTFGHVAYVWKVSGSTVYLWDYNVGWDGIFYDNYTTATEPNGGPNNYIHIGTLPTSSTTYATPASISFNGALNVFTVGSDYQLYTQYWNGSSWSGYTSIGSSMLSNPAVIVNGSGLNVFERGGDGQIYAEYNTGSGWSGWASLGSHQMKGNPTVMHYGSEMDVFALDTNNMPYKDTWNSTSGWGGWGSLGNYMASDPSAVQYGSSLEVVMRGGDNAIYVDTWNGSSWSGFNSLSGGLSGNPLALSYSAEGELDVWANAPNQNLYKDTSNGSSWGGWGNGMGSGYIGSPYAMQYNNDMEVYDRGTDNNIYSRYWSYSGQSWSGWASLNNPTMISDPSAYQYGSTELDVFATGNSDDKTYKDTFTPTNGWGGFSSL